MNKLCCQLDIDTLCEECGSKWCYSCFAQETSDHYLMDHLISYRTADSKESTYYYFCPLKQLLVDLRTRTLRRSKDLYGRPYELRSLLAGQSKEGSSLDTKETK